MCMCDRHHDDLGGDSGGAAGTERSDNSFRVRFELRLCSVQPFSRYCRYISAGAFVLYSTAGDRRLTEYAREDPCGKAF
jgi:hypothetical protein